MTARIPSSVQAEIDRLDATAKRLTAEAENYQIGSSHKKRRKLEIAAEARSEHRKRVNVATYYLDMAKARDAT